MNEPSHRRRLPSYKLLIYLNLLILWNSSPCDRQHQVVAIKPPLPANEVSSLMTLTRQFKSKVTYSFTSSFCETQTNNYGSSIKCKDSCYDDGSTNCHIVEIAFSSLGLTGTIDAAIGDLQFLNRIILSNNKLQGPIPSSLGNLLQLENLDLSNNQLSGTIPESLGNLQNLKWLYLQNNYLEGSIPTSLGQLKILIDLYLGFNMLSGSIPRELGFLYKLKRLSLVENRLSGSLPDTLGNLKYLLIFWVPSNYFTGILPDTFSNFTWLRSFGIAGNQLSGPLPLYVKDWQRIEYLALQGNKFEGPFPAEYFTLPNLEHLMISDLNTYPFQLPHSAMFSNIYTLILRNCSIIGSIPKYIGELSSLRHLDFSFNSLTGGVPESMRPNLIYMSLARNKLNGTIPHWIFQASETRLDLSYNNFSEMKSPVPSGLDLNLFACCCCQSSPTMEPYMLQPDQMMKANIPGKKPKFYSLYINSGGEQTNSPGKHYEADNETSPFYVSPMKNWAYSFSGDFFVVTANSSDYTKRVPCKISNSNTSVYDDARLSPVSLTYHGFSLRNGPYNVTLHFVEIVFIDDAEYNSLRKRLFDVYIQGTRVLQDFNIRDQAGGPNEATTMTFLTQVNDSLLTIHLFWAGKGSFFSAPAYNGPMISAISVDPLFDVGGEKLSPLYIALISVASLVFALLLFLAFAWYMGWLEDKELQEWIKIGERIKKKDMTSQANDEEDNDIKVRLKVLVNATGKFSETEEYMLGKGLLGKVYKAQLDQPFKIIVAVKRLFPHHKGKINDLIKQEIYNLKLLENENLLKLWDFHFGKRLQLLVYEYMEKKSLESFLTDSKILELTWQTRFEICLGVARGLEFLHKHPRFMIVHGNIKASNILLDRNFQPKLSDFGLANVYTDEDQPNIIRKEAPEGYLAPEYLRLKNPNRETDIFSFGVVLLEIVCGLKNKATRAIQDSSGLLDEAHKYYKSENKLGLESMVGGKLESGDEDKQALDVLNLAVMCTDISPSCRPNISHIVSVLSGEKTIDEISQAIDASNKKNTGSADAKNVADKNEDSKSKEETISSPSTSTAMIEYEATK